jgi:glutamyl-tRNA reductase
MSLFVLGVSHHSAAITLLDEVARASAAVPALLADLDEAPTVTEAMVLATCNRLEVYAAAPAFHPAIEDVMAGLAAHSGVPLDRLRPNLYLHHAERAAEHLFLTTSGLDSMVVGETQIRYQVKNALAQARASGTVGPVLSELVHTALRVGKRAQTETSLDQAGRSLADEGFAALADAGVDTAGSSVLVLGAGSMAAVAAVAARRRAAADVVVVNRDSDRGARLARAVSGRTAGWDDLPAELARTDVLVACTGAAGVLVDATTVAAARDGADRVLGVLDLAMPHDVDPEVGFLDDVVLRGMVDLAARLDRTEPADPSAVVARARAIVAEEVEAYVAARAASTVAPTVAALRRRADEVVAAELARLRSRLGPDLDPHVAEEAATTVRRVVSKLLHAPTVRVKAAAQSSAAHDYERALRHLFALDPATVHAVSTAGRDAEPDEEAVP